MIQTIKDAYLANRKKINIIVVDWEAASGKEKIDYDVVSLRVPVVAKRLADLIKMLVDDFGISTENINLIGHSLGAQISGATGRRFKELTRLTLPVIVGLDPALPGFDNEKALKATDAKYVQVIHTNSGELGYETPIGTADFYPNYDENKKLMPGCTGFSYIGYSCSHARAYEYFAESINSDVGFRGWKCNSFDELKDRQCKFGYNYAFMGGEPVNLNAKGVFNLQTGSEPPFAKSF